MKNPSALALAVSLAVLIFAAPSRALADDAAGYSEAKDQAGQVVRFRDDPLDGTGIGAVAPVIRAGSHAQRITLMRPRLNFVGELRKSVEHM